MESFPPSTTLGFALRELEPITARLGPLTKDLASSVQVRPSAWLALAEASKGIEELMRLRDPWQEIARGLDEPHARLRTITFPSTAIADRLAGINAMPDIGALTRGVVEASRFTALGDLRLTVFQNLDFDGIANPRVPMVEDFARVSQAYSEFLSRHEAAARPLSASVVGIPAREYFLSAEASAEVGEESATSEGESEWVTAREETRLHVYSTVEEAL
jgi:hypothetical protein